MKMHLAYGDYAACGREVPRHRATTTAENVTCAKCRGTFAWETQNEVDGYARAARLQAIIDPIAERLGEWAEDNEVCSLYDEAVSIINDNLPSGVTWPGRSKPTWDVDLSGSTVTAMTEDEAYEHIVANIRDFIRLS